MLNPKKIYQSFCSIPKIDLYALSIISSEGPEPLDCRYCKKDLAYKKKHGAGVFLPKDSTIARGRWIRKL